MTGQDLQNEGQAQPGASGPEMMTTLEHGPTGICFSLPSNTIHMYRRKRAWHATTRDLLVVVLGILAPGRPEAEKA